MTDVVDTLAATLRTLHERLGESMYANRKRLMSLLSDQLPESKVYIRSVDTAVGEGLPEALSGSDRELVALKMDAWVDRLASSTAMQADIARSVVRAIAYSLDLGPMPSQYPRVLTPTPQPIGNGGRVAPPPMPAPVPGPSSNWIDVSAPVGPTARSGGHAGPPGYPSYGSQSLGDPSYGGQGSYGPPPTPPRKTGLTTILVRVSIGVIALFVLAMIVGKFAPDDDTETGPGNAAAPVIAGGTAPAPPPAATGAATFGEEARDFGVPAQATLQANVGSPTPTSIPVGSVVTTGQVRAMLAGSPKPQLVDVFAGTRPKTTIQGAAYIADAGKPGTFDDTTQETVRRAIAALPAAQEHRPLIFFCLGAQCWESYNAVLRANAAGFSNLYWYRGGLQSWTAAGGAFGPLPG